MVLRPSVLKIKEDFLSYKQKDSYPFWSLKPRFAHTVFHEYFIEIHGPSQVDAGSFILQTEMKSEHKNEVLNGV